MTTFSPRWTIALMRGLAFVALILLLFETRAAFADPADASFDSPVYRVARPIPIRRCTIDGNDWQPGAAAPSPPVARTRDAMALQGWKFYPIKEVHGTVVVQFLLWERASPPAKSLYYHRFNVAEEGDKFEVILWCMNKADAERAAVPYNFSYKPDVAFGVLVVPIKLRLGTGKRETAFTTDISLAGALDLNWGVPSGKWRIHVPFFAGVGAVDIAPQDSNLEESRNVPAVSLGLGFGFSGSVGGAGLVVGWDVINGNNGSNKSIGWDYQGRAWIGISVGATFGVQPKTPENSQ